MNSFYQIFPYVGALMISSLTFYFLYRVYKDENFEKYDYLFKKK